MSKLVEIDIHDLAFDGKAVGQIGGKVVFLDAGLPGERVLARITRRKPRYDEARVERVLSPSEDRVPPVCVHFAHCGGCAWQDLDYQRQLEFKRKQVQDCLVRLGGLKDVEVTPTLPSPDVFFYRNKMEFSFHVQPDGGFTLGLHRRGRFDDIFDLHACHLQSERSNRIVSLVREFVSTRRIAVYDVRHHAGFMRFLVVREGKNTGQVMINLVTNYGDFPCQSELVDALTTAEPDIVTIVHNQNGQKSNVATGEVETVIYGPGYIEERLLGCTFRIRANSFFQTNTRQAERLYALAIDLLDPSPDMAVLDLYCGAGVIGILVADRVREVTGIESVGDAVAAARENAALNGRDNCRFIEGDVRRVLREQRGELPSPDAVILDPPRGGLHPKALSRVVDLSAPRLVYVSCNPATFARDARILCDDGYALGTVQPVDMFPHTKHIELVARFDR